MRATALLLFGIAACLHAAADVVAAEARQCGHARVAVQATTATATDFHITCDAVRAGVEFLNSLGMDTDVTLQLTVVDELPSPHGVGSLGQFDPERGEIRILSLARCLAACAANPPFGIPMNVEIHRSFIVHEVVHAITHAALAGRNLPRLRLEYLAYVAQITSLPEDLRARLIAAGGVEGFQRDDQINQGVYFLDPNRFGIMCYLHYRRPENGNAYLRKILGL